MPNPSEKTDVAGRHENKSKVNPTENVSEVARSKSVHNRTITVGPIFSGETYLIW